MKCDKLKAEPMIINDDYMALYYPKESVDAAIAELKEVYKDSVDVKVKIWERYKKAEDELRKTQRALWLARAERAKWESLYYWYAISNKYKSRKFNEVELKCRAKAEEYK